MDDTKMEPRILPSLTVAMAMGKSLGKAHAVRVRTPRLGTRRERSTNRGKTIDMNGTGEERQMPWRMDQHMTTPPVSNAIRLMVTLDAEGGIAMVEITHK